MGLFDFFKRKQQTTNSKDRESRNYVDHMSINTSISNLYNSFLIELEGKDDGAGEQLTYWYGIIKNRAEQEHLLGHSGDDDLFVKQLVYGHNDEYQRREDLAGASQDEYEEFIKMRIFSYGIINEDLKKLELKISELLNSNDLRDHQVKKQIHSEIIQAKSAVYGAIKFALSKNISKQKILKWYPEFVDDAELIRGANPFDSFNEKFDTDISSGIPQYDLSEEEKSSIPEWYTGDIIEEGFIIKDEKTGKEIQLTRLEASIYEFLKTNEKIYDAMIYDMQFGGVLNSDAGIKSLMKVASDRTKGKAWLKENNLDAYKVLLSLVPDLDDETEDDD